MSYIKRFPTVPNLTLAKKIYKENPKVFINLENVRSIVRSYKGANGKERRESTSGITSNFVKSLNDFKKEMPKAEKDFSEPYHLPKSQRKVLMMSDVHIPYYDESAIHAALKYGLEKEVDTIWLNGDIMDMYQLSRFEKDPRKRDFKYELDATRTFLQLLRKMFPKALILFKMGNHCVRWEKFLRLKAPELLDIEEFQLSVLLKFNELGIIEIGDKQLAYCGELKVLHYHELPLKSGGVNPARAVYLKTNESVIGGHYHRKSEHVERTLGNKVIKVYSTGCLCDLNPDYMPYNNWSHGFAYIQVAKDGSYVVDNKTIIDGVVY